MVLCCPLNVVFTVRVVMYTLLLVFTDRIVMFTLMFCVIADTASGTPFSTHEGMSSRVKSVLLSV